LGVFFDGLFFFFFGFSLNFCCEFVVCGLGLCVVLCCVGFVWFVLSLCCGCVVCWCVVVLVLLCLCCVCVVFVLCWCCVVELVLS